MNRKRNTRLYYILTINLMLYTYILSIYTGLLNLFFVSFLVLVNSLSFTNITFIDPGYICKKYRNLNTEKSTEFLKDINCKIFYAENGWRKIIKIDNQVFIQKYCEECQIFKPHQVSHCRECDCCVIGIDHHCFWFDTCIAKNTITYFYFYLFSIIGILYVILNSLTYFLKNTQNINLWVFVGVYIVKTLVRALFYVMTLFSLYYLYLAITNIGSRDFIKEIKRYQHPKLRFIKKIFRIRKSIACSLTH